MPMQNGASGLFGMALQSGWNVPAASGFRYYPFTGLPMAPVQPQEALPAEAGRAITTRGSYKSGLWSEGGLNLIPRFAGDFGTVLSAAIGEDQYTTASHQNHRINTYLFEANASNPVVVTAGGTGTGTFAATGIAGSILGGGVLKAGDTFVTNSPVNPGPFTVSSITANLITVTETVATQTTGLSTMVFMGTGLTTSETGLTGCNVHPITYRQDAGAIVENFIPYFTARRLLPYSEAANQQMIEVLQDMRMRSIEFNIPAVGPATAAIDAAGRTPSMARGPQWETANFDDDRTVALAIHPSSRLMVSNGRYSSLLKATSMTFVAQNRLLDADGSRYAGSPTPYDYPVLGRSAQVRVTAILEDWDVYMALFNGVNTDGTIGASWNPSPLRGNVDIRAFSPMPIGTATDGTPAYYGVQFINGNAGNSNNVAWSLQNAVPLEPQRVIYLSLLGTIEQVTGGATVPYTANFQCDDATAFTAFGA